MKPDFSIKFLSKASTEKIICVEAQHCLSSICFVVVSVELLPNKFQISMQHIASSLPWVLNT